MTERNSEPIHVLVVDDSAFMRKSLSSMLEKHPDIHVVATARDGEDALRKVRQFNPDVMTLDIVMPSMNGLSVLQEVMGSQPLPVVVVSALTEEGAYETVKALELGAVDFLPKPSNGSVLRIGHIESELVSKVRTAARARRDAFCASPGSRSFPGHHAPDAMTSSSHKLRTSAANVTTGKATLDSIVVIGCSTGGPQALRHVLPRLPGDFPAGLVIAQHMPKYFTKPFAQQLNMVCAIEVREAQDGDRIEPGTAFIAPGGRHLAIHSEGSGIVYARVSDEPREAIYRPSVDVLMESAAVALGRRTIGVVLTGMGHDGLAGMRAIQKKGGWLIVQDEASSLIYGMPKAVAEAGLPAKRVALSEIAATILACVAGQATPLPAR